MKLWEALEKSNKVRRKDWDNDFYVTMSPVKKIAEISKGYTVKSITIEEFYADDWDPYEELSEILDRMAEQHQKEVAAAIIAHGKEHGIFPPNSPDEKIKTVLEEYEPLWTLTRMIQDQAKILSYHIDRIDRIEEKQLEHDKEIRDLKALK